MIMDKYLLMYKGNPETLGMLSIDVQANTWEFEPNPRYTGEQPWFVRYSNAPTPLNERIKAWVLARSPEPNYEFIDTLIEKAGLGTYDPYGFFKYNRGHFITDKFYVEMIEGDDTITHAPLSN